jgi:hypothetical protein
MANMTLPTEAEVKAIDTTAFTWDDLLDGLLSKSQASVIKAVGDKMESGETMCIAEPFAATGKTAKFVLDNVTGANNLKIVTSDSYVDTYLTTSDYFTNTGNVGNVYKHDTSGNTEIVFNGDGDATSIKFFDANTDPANPTLRREHTFAGDEITALGTNDLANYEIVWPALSTIKNSSDELLGSSTTADSFNPDVWVIIPWIVNMGYPNFDLDQQKRTFAYIFNKMEAGEVFVITHFHVPNVNNAFWATMNAMTATGKNWSVEYLLNTESDNSGAWQAAAVKKA